MSARFWEESSLVRIQVFRCPLIAGFPTTHLAGNSRLLSAISTKPGLVSVSGCPASLVRTLVKCGRFPRGVQYPFRFDVMSLKTLMYQQGESFFGPVDFCSQLRYLIVFLSGILTEAWTLEAPELTKVGHHPLPSIGSTPSSNYDSFCCYRQ